MNERRDPLATLIDADRAVEGPDGDTLQRMWTGIEQGVASGAPGPVLDTQPLLPAAGGLGLKVLGLALVTSLVGVVALRPGDDAPHSVQRLSPTVEVPTVVPPAPPKLEPPEPLQPAPVVEPAIEQAVREPRPQRRPRAQPEPERPTTTPGPTLADELALMRKIGRALSAGDTRTAAALLDDHGERFPDGALKEERVAAEVRIACMRDRPDAAKRRASFERRWPKSMHAAAVASACD